MSVEKPQPVQHLADYRPWPFTLSQTRRDVTLAPRDTVVLTELDLEPSDQPVDLVLDGGAGLRLQSLRIDGLTVDPAHVLRDDETLTIRAAALPRVPFTLATDVRIDPQDNTAFEGLYLSGGI